MPQDLWPPPLKVSRGHMGNIQCRHMGGGLDVPGPHVTLYVHQKCQKCTIQFGLMGNKRQRGWTSHRSCLSTASRFVCDADAFVALAVVNLDQRDVPFRFSVSFLTWPDISDSDRLCSFSVWNGPAGIFVVSRWIFGRFWFKANLLDLQVQNAVQKARTDFVANGNLMGM